MALTHPGDGQTRHPQEDNVALIVELQNAAGVAEIIAWIKRRVKKEAGTGLWCSVDGLCVAPASFLPLSIKEAHGLDHTHRAETIRKIHQEWWSPYLASMMDHALNWCDVCIRNNMWKNFTSPLGHIPPPTGPFWHILMDYVDMGSDNRKERKRYILVITDHFSRWVEATATSKEDARSAAKFLCREVIQFSIQSFSSGSVFQSF